MTFDVSFIGFGEAGQAFANASGWASDARAYDRLTDIASTRDAKQADYARCGVIGEVALDLAIADAPLVLSLVTAGEALTAAQAAARTIEPGALFCDCNSVAPQTKQAAARAIEQAGARYVDVAIMSPVNPAQLDVPLLLSGMTPEAAATALRRLGFSDVRVVGERVGRASAIKMIRSVIVKGTEALTAEAMLAAAAADVTEEVLASLDSSEKSKPWGERADYNLDRMLVHGLRRAEEMAEAAATLTALGIDPTMTRSTVERQRALGALELKAPAQGLAAKIAQINERVCDA